MNDLVSRQEALDEIDKNRQTLLSLGMNVEEYVLFHYCRRVIEDLPTIDAVPVVRCKDCKRHNAKAGKLYRCDLRNVWQDGDFFCANGERSEE